jgi:hypothetical protein
MKNLLRSTVSYWLVMSMLALTLPLVPQSAAISTSNTPRQQEKKRRVKDSKVKRGPEVTERVKKLKGANKSVLAALKKFEKNGRNPQLEDSLLISGTISEELGKSNRSGRGLIQKVGLKPQQTTVSGNGYELILVPSLVVEGEWQGTAICTRYDESGNVVEQYTSNIVTVEDYDGSTKVVYEVRYEGATPYLVHEPGMYTGFALGATIQEYQTHFGAPPPLDLLPEQFGSPEQEQQYYELYPRQRDYEREPAQLEQRIARRGGVTFMRASFSQRSDLTPDRFQLRPCGGQMVRMYGCGSSGNLISLANLRDYVVQVSAGCSGTTLACRGNPQCSALACAGVAVARLPVVFGY